MKIKFTKMLFQYQQRAWYRYLGQARAFWLDPADSLLLRGSQRGAQGRECGGEVYDHEQVSNQG